MNHSVKDQNRFLKQLGFRFSVLNPSRRREAISQFQLLVGLVPDGKYGPKTTFAMSNVLANDGRVSENFRFIEFQCKCGGKYSSCRGIKLDKKLVDALEKIRTDYYRNGLLIVSAYRCDKHNKAIGGAKQSQHVAGRAADIPPRVKHDEKFPSTVHGIGYQKKTKLVRHVDTRPGPLTKWVY